jgi:hypothetical protein
VRVAAVISGIPGTSEAGPGTDNFKLQLALERIVNDFLDPVGEDVLAKLGGGPGTGNTFSLHRTPPRLHQSQGTDQPSHEQRQGSTRDAGCPPVLEFHSNQRLPR